MLIPSLLLKKLYTIGSLHNSHDGVRFSLKNRLNDVTITELVHIKINGQKLVLAETNLQVGDGSLRPASSLTKDQPLAFPLRQTVDILTKIEPLAPGKHEIDISFITSPFGKLTFKVEDTITEDQNHRVRIPRNDLDDYNESIIKERQAFLESFTGKTLHHIKHYSFDPHVTQGNCESFTGVAQVPMGIVGPLNVQGEHAQGDFLIPLATSEGTLVASYNRGIKLINLCGGVRCTVVDDVMQRAPVFVFSDARKGRAFAQWIQENIDTIRTEAEATSSIAKLRYIDHYLSNKFVFLRFNYSTGDAAGQNMVGRATFAACSWIHDHYEGIQHFYLESNFATDKKASQINIMRTRGKRVTAEAVIKKDVLIQHMRVDPETLAYHAQVANMGAVLSGANNNGLHSANAITAIFIATGQDVANVAESSAGLLYTELTPEKDLYISITIPSLIVATYGGGTGLPTQRESLELLDCYGKGKVNKFAEIVAGVVLAGELSLGAAISSLDWVSSHEQYGRNR